MAASECIFASFPEDLGPTSPLHALPSLVHGHAHHKVVDGGVLPHSVLPGRGAASIAGRTAPRRGSFLSPLLNACPPTLPTGPNLDRPRGPSISLRVSRVRVYGLPQGYTRDPARAPRSSSAARLVLLPVVSHLLRSSRPSLPSSVLRPLCSFHPLYGGTFKSAQTVHRIGCIMLIKGKGGDSTRFPLASPAPFVKLAHFLSCTPRPRSSSLFSSALPIPTPLDLSTSARNVCMAKWSYAPFPGEP